MFTTDEELELFKEKVVTLLNKKGGALNLHDFCGYFKELTGKTIKGWFKNVKDKRQIPKPMHILVNFCDDIIEIDFVHGQSPFIKIKTKCDGSSFQDHLESMSSHECEKQLQQTVEHVKGTSKEFALSIEEDDDIVEVKSNKHNEEIEDERAVQAQVENFQLYRDYQMIHITYVKLRIVSLFNNHGANIIGIPNFMQAFRAMFCENFFTRSILKHFVSDSSHRSEDFVSYFVSRFCTEFLKVGDDRTIMMTLSVPPAHVKFLNQLICALEKLATPGYAVKEIDPTPAEMMMLGKAVTEPGGIINTKTVRTRHQNSTFINFPTQLNLNNFSGERPTIQEINERVNQIRNRICREGRCVKLPDVLQEVCSFYKVTCVGDLYPTGSREIRREGDIPALYDIILANGKVNAFIQAFIEFRNVCTLHELEEEICKMENKAAFTDLKLGPLQKQLLVYEFFKFPPDKEPIPPITTLEVFRLLWKCQSEIHRSNRGRAEPKERDRLTLHQFMDFFIKQHGFNDPFESGVRINSIGLAISVVRKAWFGDMHNIRDSVQKFTKQLCEEFDQHLKHASTSIIGKNKGLPGEPENLVQKIAGMNLLEGFSEMYGMLQKMKKEACKTLPGTAHLVNFSDITMNALSVIQKDELMRRIFHVLLSTAPLKTLGKDDVTILNSLGFKPVIDEMVKKEKEKTVNQKKDKPKKSVVSKAMVTNTTKKWLSKNPDLSLEVLSNIECQVTSEVGNYDCFDDLGHGSFLKFIIAEKRLQGIVESCLGTSGSGKSRLTVSKKEINNFVYQCGDGSKPDEISKAFSRQFNIREVDRSLLAQIDDALDVKQSDPMISYQHAFLCGSDVHNDVSQSDIAYFAESAMKRIFSAPYLVCINNWTNWDWMFEPKLGALKDFLQTFQQTGVNFFFMETSRNKFIKVLKDCPYQHLFHSLKQLDAPMTATCILSILLSSCHINDAPIALLSNHMQKALLEFAGKGGEESGEILSFCLDCFTLLPFEILCCVIRKLFLSPLAEIYGALKVPDLLLNTCAPYSEQKNVLHLLGFNLSVEEWKKDYEGELAGLTVHKEPVICIEDDELTIPAVVSIDDDKEVVELPIVVSDESKDKVHVVSRPEKNQKNQIETPDSILIIDHKTVVSKPAEIGNEDFRVEILIEEDADEIVESDQEAVFAVVSNLVDKVAIGEVPELIENIILDPVMQRLNYCETYIERIRREQFGVGLKFGVEEEKLIDIFRQRQGRSLYRLSQELYTKDSHFVLELIQNADDNEYPEDMTTEKPTVAFIVEADKITILNNEKGFKEDNVKALCDVGKSTKGIHRKGYIGQKGIGFKSVFRVTDNPQIHSNGFHIMFDALSGPNGYICPQWIKDWKDHEHISYKPTGKETFSWTTKIVLPLKTEMQHSKLTSRFHDIHPSLLMFLNRLQTIIIDDKVSGTMKIMRKEVRDESMIELSHNNESSLWLVVSKEISIDIRDDIKNTGISVAFPIEIGDGEIKSETLPVQPVFAFLPLRSYGFKFIIQADFEVPSSREDIDKDSSWNQCILRHIPQLVVDAFHNFKNHSYFKNLRGVIDYFKFMNVEDRVLGVFKQVGRNIIKSLQRECCLPVDMTSRVVSRRNKDIGYQWMIPSSVIVSQAENKDVVSPEILKEHLGLYYVHKDVQKKISPYILKILGVSKISLDQLVEISKALIRQFSEQDVFKGEKSVKRMHAWIGQWMHIIYKTLQENCDCSQQTLDMLKSLNIFALSDGSLVSLNNAVVFFPVENQTQRGIVEKEMEIIENDLKVLSRELTSKLDQIQLQQVMRLLKDLGVKLMTPFDLVHNNIIPIFKTGKWKEKAEDLIVAFVAYLHKQLLLDPELFDLNEMKDCIALQTNKGFFCPSNELIYFTPDYGNPVNLIQKFPACDWTLISDVYIKCEFSNIRRKQWEDYFAQLGLQYFAMLRKKTETLHKSDIATSVWEKCSEKWPETEDETYVIHDLVCPEFTTLLQSKKIKQISCFALEVDSRWKKYFADYNLGSPKCSVETTKGKRIAVTHSSFALQIRTLPWLPSDSDKSKLFQPSELYVNLAHIKDLFSNKVNYLTEKIKDKNFIQTLGVLSDIPFDKFIDAFKTWREKKLFTSTFQHTIKIYGYLQDNLREHSTEIKELLEGNFVFLLSTHCSQRLTAESVAEGSFFKIKNVCWEDPSGIIVKSVDINHRRILKGYYPDDMRDFFVNNIGIDRYPSTKEYLNLIYNIASKTTLPDKNACLQICTLFSVIGNTCIVETMRDEVAMWYLPEQFNERVQLYTDLEEHIDPNLKARLQSNDVCEEKIFPTASNTFASLSQKPLLTFNNDLAPVFKKEENVPIIFIDNIVKMLKRERNKSHGGHKRAEVDEQVKHVIRCICLFKACGMQLLSDVYIPAEVITIGMSRGCRKWEKILHDITPFIQRFIASNLPDVYLRLKAQHFHQYLKNSTFFCVQGLEVIHRLRDREDVNVKQLKVSNVEAGDVKAFIYITDKYVDDKSQHENILCELMTLFVGKFEQYKDTLLDFALVTNKQSYLKRKAIHNIPSGDTVWEYPEPERLPPPPPTPVVIPMKPAVKPNDGEQKLTCWPPRKPGNTGSATKPDSVREDEEAIFKKWKQPEAPGMEVDVAIPKVPSENTEGVTTDHPVIVNPPHAVEQGISTVSNVKGQHSQATSTVRSSSSSNSGTSSPSKPSSVQSSAERASEPTVKSTSNSKSKPSSKSGESSESNEGSQPIPLSASTQSTASTTQVSTDSKKPTKSPPSEGLKRKREHSGMEHGGNEAVPHQSNSDSVTTPKSKKPFSPSTVHRPPDYTAPVSRNLTTNKIDLNVLGHSALDLDTEYEDLPFDGNQDLEEGELQGSMEDREVNDDANLITSKLGEEVVYNHLSNVYKLQIAEGSVRVDWLNSEGESKSPYDVKITFAETDRSLPIYVEVKATINDERTQFQISSQQLKFAFAEGSCFHLYRVSNLYKGSNLKIKRLVNLSSYMDRKAVKLYMLL